MAFSLTSTVQIGAAVLRVQFSGSMPLSASKFGPHDCRNPANWRLFGTSIVDVGEVRTIPSDPFSFDLICTAVVEAGAWVVIADNVTTVHGEALESNQVVFEAVGAQPFFAVPSDQITSETALRQALNAALDGPGWQAFIAALGYSDEKVAAIGRAAFYQRLLATAGGEYLERLTTSYGVDRPPNVRMSDDTLRNLTIGLNNNKVNATGLEAVLLAYYGLDATVAHAQSGMPELFDLEDGDDLHFVIDDTEVSVVFRSEEFSSIGLARATEVAAVINRQLQLAGLKAFSTASTDPETGLVYLRVYSGLSGIRGRMRFIGGDAMRALRFQDIVGTAQAVGTQWSLEPSTVANSVPVGSVRLTWTGGTDPQLSAVFPGDYVNIYGAPFNAENCGVFQIVATTTTSIDFAASGFETEQSVVTQTGGEDVFFVRPRIIGLNGQYVASVVGPAHDAAEILLPVTAVAVERVADTAWYLNGRQSLFIDGDYAESGRLDGNTTVRLKTTEPHGMSAGRYFFLDEVEIDYTEDLGDPLVNVTLVPNGVIYAAVQLDNDDILAFIDSESTPVSGNNYFILDHVTGSWTDMGAHPFADTYPPAMCKMADGRVLAVGDNTWSIYDPELDVWTSAVSSGLYMDVPPYQSMVLLRDNNILAVHTDGGNVLSSIFNVTTLTWSATQLIDEENYMYQCAVRIETTGDVIVAGGWDGSSIIAKAYYYRWLNDEWEFVDDMPEPVNDPFGAFVPRGQTGEVWFVGSVSGTNGDIQIFDGYALAWSTRPTAQTVPDTVQRALVVHGTDVYWIPATDSLQWELHTEHTSTVVDGTFGQCETDDQYAQSWAFHWSDGSIVAMAVRDSYPGHVGIFYQYAAERTRSGGHLAGGLFKVTATPAPDILEFVTPESSTHTRISAARLTPAMAELGTIKSGFMLNPQDGVAMADAQTTLTADVNKGFVPQVIQVGDTSEFPDEPGYLVIGFGTARQSAPVHFLGIASATSIRLDPNEKFTFGYDSGATVTLLRGRGVYAPEVSQPLGATWLTDSSIGRIEAEKDLLLTEGVGENVIHRVLYPGDRGLGNEGLPRSGVTKISDVIGIWGSDNYLSETQTAREDE